jgi:hypothetical protein
MLSWDRDVVEDLAGIGEEIWDLKLPRVEIVRYGGVGCREIG